MPLRPSLQNKIWAIIEDHGFLAADFELSTQAKTSGTNLFIGYRYHAAHFKAELPANLTIRDKETYYQINIHTKPGTINIEEAAYATGEASLIKHLSSWLERLSEDIAITPQQRALQDVERLVAELYERIGIRTDADDILHESQRMSIIEWIKSLEEKMASNIQSAEIDRRAMESQIESLHRQVELLNKIVNSQTSKKGVVRAIVSRIVSWGSKPENQKLLKEAGAMVTGLLTDGDKKH